MSKTRISITFTEEQLAFMKKHEEEFGVSIQGFVNVAVNDRIDQLQGLKSFLQEVRENRKKQADNLNSDTQ